MAKFRLLWFDLSVAVQEAELPPYFREYCSIARTRDRKVVERLLQQGEVDVLCLDYDYPDRRSLRLLQELRSNYPSTLMLMLTLQHSENLAVWALRSRVWDYLVKPISNNEIERCARGINKVLELSKGQPPRRAEPIAQHIPAEAEVSLRPDEEVRFLPALNYVEQHFRAKIRNEDVAKLCHMSPFHFSRGFKAHFGVGFRDYVLHFRLREAKRMLTNPNAVVSEVCYACGFSEPSYFAKVFRRQFQVSPSEAIGSDLPFAASPPRLDPLPLPLQVPPLLGKQADHDNQGVG